MQHIVVGYDGGDSARLAVVEAGHVARCCGAELHVMNVVDTDVLLQGMTFEDAQMAAESAAEEISQRVIDSDELAGVVCHNHAASGPPAALIMDHAAEIGADLIVVGNRRVHGLERILGSVAVQIVRHAPCSVYVAHTT